MVAVKGEKAAAREWMAVHKPRVAAMRGGVDGWEGMAVGHGMTEGRKQAGSWRYSAAARG